MVAGSVQFGFGQIGGNINTNYNVELRSLFSSNKVKVPILGGNANTIVTDYDSFMNYLKHQEMTLLII